MVALLESQRSDTKNPSKLTIIRSFLFFDNYFEILNEFLAKKITSFTFPFRF